MPNRELTPEQEERIAELFRKLDISKDGKLCKADLKTAFEQLKVPTIPGNEEQMAELLLAAGDLNNDGLLDFKEFANWMLEHEEQLGIAFKSINKKADGYIDAEEIKDAFSRLGISIDDDKAKLLLKRMDIEGNRLISESEWREFLQLQTGRSLAEIANYWEHTLMGTLDTGDEAQIPDDFSPEQLQSGQAIRMLISGGLAGAVSRTCTAPLDRLKVLRQVYGYQHVGSSAANAFSWMLREGGALSLWRGNGVNVLKIAPETAIKYTAYDFYKRRLFPKPELAIYEKFIAGSLAGVTSQTVIYPLEVAKTRMCLRKTGQFKGGLAECLASVYREGGVRALFRGYHVNVMGIVPYAGIELAAYETTRRWLSQQQVPQGQAPPVYALLLSGAFASSIGIVLCYPLALLRTKMQSKVQFSRPELNSLLGLSRQVFRAEGVPGFYRGLGANLCKVLPSVAISFATFERLNHYFNIAHPFADE